MKLFLRIDLKYNGNNDFGIDIEPIVCSFDKPKLNFLDAEYTPSKGDKYYFLPGVNIPRVKLKDLTIQHGVKTVRNIEDATHIFAGDGTIAKMTDSHWVQRSNTEDFLEFIEIIKDDLDEYYLEKVTQAFEHYTEKVIIVKSNVWSVIKYNVPISHPKHFQLQNCAFTEGLRTNSIYGYTPEPAYESVLATLVTKEVYNEDLLLCHLNGPDAVVIDADMYNQIALMFDSSDVDNHILAMEIMANCKYKESLLYLEFLFKEYSDQMYSCHTKNHVNFKSLLSYLGKRVGYMNTSIDDIVKSMIDKGVLDTAKVNTIMERYSSQILEIGESTFFKVKSITVNEDLLTMLNEDFTYSVKDSFIPVVVEDTEETLELELVAEEGPQEEGHISEVAIEPDMEVTAVESFSMVSESELNKPEEQSNNNQIEETNGDDAFEWF